MMIKEFDLVVLTRDLPEHRLRKDDVGTVVMVHGQGLGYEVEFATFSGVTISVITLPHDAVRPIKQGEIAHVREVA
jgi:hypothetical protein